MRFSLLFLLFIIVWLIKGNIHFQVSHYRVEDQALPESFVGYTIAHLSDLHSKEWGASLTNSIEEEEPEIIVITGDLIDLATVDMEPVLDFIDEIIEIAPIYYVSGNHEALNKYYEIFEKQLIEQGVNVLNNDGVILEKGDDEIVILGLQDPYFIPDEKFLNAEKIIDATLNEMTENYEGYRLLLSHRPELFEIYLKNEIDLVFAGHAHGGQVRLPFIGGVFAPDQGFSPKYTLGVYQESDTQMIVSRGLGNGSVPVRINNTPELVIVELTNATY